MPFLLIGIIAIISLIPLYLVLPADKIRKYSHHNLFLSTSSATYDQVASWNCRSYTQEYMVIDVPYFLESRLCLITFFGVFLKIETSV